MEDDAIYKRVKEVIVSEFKIQESLISPEKLLYDELGLDSLDAVDLLVTLKNEIGTKVDPGLFKNAKTVQDVVEILRPLWSKQNS
jgi:acyl carrier protein